ncbi:MAG: response regulator [Proteobacteria bacterium]|nr:response regulator [Pseudomonadota bacterium]
MICSFVETMGFGQVQGCRSAKEALSLLTTDPSAYFCVITDMRMPDISGEQLIEQIRRHPKLLHLPVIVLTAYGSADNLLGCLRAGASGFLVKPPKRSDMARELGRAYRIALREGSPRLASPDEVEALRGVLEQRGFA